MIYNFIDLHIHRSVCERFDIGKATGWRTVWRFVFALYKYLPTFIKWPTNQEALITSAHIKRRFGFPGVIGAVDGTHISIAAPHDNPHNYINRKGVHSIQTQVILTTFSLLNISESEVPFISTRNAFLALIIHFIFRLFATIL